MSQKSDRRTVLRRVAAGALAAAAWIGVTSTSATAQAPNPITIGFSMSLTGPLASNGKSSLLAMKIWEDDVNGKGGLAGRPVKLVYYDDQSNPALVPQIYTKLLDVDKVNLVVSAYATNMIAPAMPIVIQKNKLFMGLFGTGVNEKFKYSRYFSMIPMGPNPKPAFTKGYFDVAMAQNPKPTTIAIASVDAEFGQNVADGARENAKAAGLKVVYDRKYPPTTTDFTPIVRAMQASGADIVVICSYPLDSVGMVRSINEIGYKPKMIGGAMVGLQSTVFKTQLGPMLNGIVNYDMWVPAKTMEFPGVMELIKKYQARAAAEGVDPLGYYMPPWAYAYLQVLGQAIDATKSVDDNTLAEYMRKSSFKTVVGDIKFGPEGEWTESRVLEVQFQGIENNDLDQFRKLSTQVIVHPAQYQSGKVIYPYADAKK